MQIIKYLSEQVAERLTFYKENNPSGAFPKSIYFFRKKLSDGNSRKVSQAEVVLIKKGCLMASGDPDYKPRITYIHCGMSKNTKFFPTNPEHIDKYGNCAPGTVVDRGITTIWKNDFYLKAHVPEHGTSRFAYYLVTHDENRLTADGFQSMVSTM